MGMRGSVPGARHPHQAFLPEQNKAKNITERTESGQTREDHQRQ